MRTIGVIIINRNDYENTNDCLNSIFENNKEVDINIILVDNGSLDGSKEKLMAKFNLKSIIPSKKLVNENECLIKDDNIFTKYKNVCIELDNNYGFTGANNIGMKFCYTNNLDFIIWLNNDTICPNGFFKKIIKNIEDKPNYLHSCCITFYPNIEIIWRMGANINFMGIPNSKFYKTKVSSYNGPKHISSLLCSGCCLGMTKETFYLLGGQDNNFFFNLDDSDFSLKANKNGIKTNVDTSLLLYHKGSSSVINKPGLSFYYYIRNLLYFSRKHYKFRKKATVFIYCLLFSFYVFMKSIFYTNGIISFFKKLIVDLYNRKLGKIESFDFD